MQRIREIEAKVLLSRVKQPDDWFGLDYNMNLYRGCQHRCIYCDSRSECYGIEDFDGEVLVKANATDLVRRELAAKRLVGTIGLGSMNDPYMPVERERRLTRSVLEVIVDFGFPVHLITKSDLVLRDLDLLERIGRIFAAVSFSLSTADDGLARKIEPYAPSPSRRLAALRTLSDRGIIAGVVMMPILPFIGDTVENVKGLVDAAAAHGSRYMVPSYGMSMRDRQREYYYKRLDESFPGLRSRYERSFGARYSCAAGNAGVLAQRTAQLCGNYGLPLKMPRFGEDDPTQASLF